MMVRWMASLTAGTAVLFWGALLASAAEPNIGQNQPAIQGPAEILQNSTLVGVTVFNPQNQPLGQIRSVLLDTPTGQATFAVIDAKAPGAGNAMLVVPYQALRVSFDAAQNRQSVVLDLRPDQLGAAPQIRNNQWQMLQNAQFLQQARNFYQAKTYTAARPIDAPPSIPGTPVMPAPVIQFVAPQPCWNYGSSDPGWTHEMEEFSQE
jgi:hypothetical protein